MVITNVGQPNIIEYRGAFKFQGKVCIIMELAGNDLYKHKNARKVGRKPPFTLQCIRHIMHQLLLGIEYIHGEGYTHRDLKPTNILVTQWDQKTDLPVVKLADFGLAGIKSDLSSLCGTPGYCAPEIEAELARRRKPQRRPAAGYKAIDQPFHYDNSVDIWGLGKILKELLADVPQETKVRGGKTMVVNKQPAMQLAQYMMQPSPQQRPTASACLQHTWLKEYNSTAGKRDRSPIPGPAVPPPSKRVLRTTSSAVAVPGSTDMLVADANHRDYGERGERGPTSRRLPAIRVDQTGDVMPDVPAQPKGAYGEGRPSTLDGASIWSYGSNVGKGVEW
jgi:serine/threonine protein kinase